MDSACNMELFVDESRMRSSWIEYFCDPMVISFQVIDHWYFSLGTDRCVLVGIVNAITVWRSVYLNQEFDPHTWS